MYHNFLAYIGFLYSKKLFQLVLRNTSPVINNPNTYYFTLLISNLKMSTSTQLLVREYSVDVGNVESILLTMKLYFFEYMLSLNLRVSS